jgi:hypothetical protein
MMGRPMTMTCPFMSRGSITAGGVGASTSVVRRFMSIGVVVGTGGVMMDVRVATAVVFRIMRRRLRARCRQFHVSRAAGVFVGEGRAVVGPDDESGGITRAGWWVLGCDVQDRFGVA